MLYAGCITSLLPYGSGCRPVLKCDEARLDAFRRQCLRTVLGVSSLRQQLEHLNICELRRIWRDTELVSDVIRRRRGWSGLAMSIRCPMTKFPSNFVLAGWRKPDHQKPCSVPRPANTKERGRSTYILKSVEVRRRYGRKQLLLYCLGASSSQSAL